MKERKLILYLDTSVIGGYYDVEFEKETKRFNKSWKRIMRL